MRLLLAVGLILVSFQSHAAALPEESRQAFARGLSSAKAEKWPEALEYFTQAQKSQPYSPPVLRNIGLIHARLGHGPAAVAWLNAYLAAAPLAHDTVPVLAEIAMAMEASRVKVRNIFRRAEDALKPIRDQRARMNAVRGLCRTMARSGEFDKACALSRKSGDTLSLLLELRDNFSLSLAKGGNIWGAVNILETVLDHDRRDAGWAAICAFLTSARDFDGAILAVTRIHRKHLADQLISDVAAAQKRAASPLTKDGILSLALKEWVKVAATLSGYDLVVNTEDAIENAVKAQRPEDVPKQLCLVAARMGEILIDLQGLQEKYACLERIPKL